MDAFNALDLAGFHPAIMGWVAAHTMSYPLRLPPRLPPYLPASLPFCQIRLPPCLPASFPLSHLACTVQLQSNGGNSTSTSRCYPGLLTAAALVCQVIMLGVFARCQDTLHAAG